MGLTQLCHWRPVAFIMGTPPSKALTSYWLYLMQRQWLSVVLLLNSSTPGLLCWPWQQLSVLRSPQVCLLVSCIHLCCHEPS